jgi:hypothetical protein
MGKQSMKIHDFGLWFYYWADPWFEWSTKIPPKLGFKIFYDGLCIGDQFGCNFDIDSGPTVGPHIIKLRKEFPLETFTNMYRIKIGRLLTLDDFEIIPNPDYLGKQ